VQDASSREEIGSSLAKFPSGTSAKNKTPAGFVTIVKSLNGIEDGRNRLRLVHEYHRRLFQDRQGLALSSEKARFCEEPRPFFRISEVNAERPLGEKAAKQRGLAGLSGAEQDMHKGFDDLPFQSAAQPTINHIDFIILALF
jgi:hypothetical protein